MAMTFIRRFTKALADYSLALVFVIACFPLFVVATLIIKSFSRGPLLYVQDRIGFNGLRFQIFKFRTMTVGAEEPGSGSVPVRSDPRIFFRSRVSAADHDRRTAPVVPCPQRHDVTGWSEADR